MLENQRRFHVRIGCLLMIMSRNGNWTDTASWISCGCIEKTGRSGPVVASGQRTHNPIILVVFLGRSVSDHLCGGSKRNDRDGIPNADVFYRLITSTLGMNCTLHWQRVRLPPFSSIVEGELTLDEAAHEAFCQLWHLWDSGMDQV